MQRVTRACLPVLCDASACAGQMRSAVANLTQPVVPEILSPIKEHTGNHVEDLISSKIEDSF